MGDAGLVRVRVGSGGAARKIAVLTRVGTSPGLFWLGGFRSDMTGTKAAALDAHAAGHGFAAGNPLAGAAGISRRAFSDRVLGALDKYQAVFETRPAGDADRATRLATRL